MQYYTKARLENARVDGSHLIIEGRNESFSGSDYTAASLITDKRFSFEYGRVEVVAKLPSARGTWPAIWMLGTDHAKSGWPKCGEIDIMEHVLVTPNTIYGTVHQADDLGKHISKGGKTDVPDYADAYHLYAIDWSHEKIDFFVDDKKYFTFNHVEGQPWAYDREMYLLVNLAIGGAWGMQSGLDAAAFPQKFEVKSVKVFQKPGMVHHVYPIH